jgi:hypothetical protein
MPNFVQPETPSQMPRSLGDSSVASAFGIPEACFDGCWREEDEEFKRITQPSLHLLGGGTGAASAAAGAAHTTFPSFASNIRGDWLLDGKAPVVLLSMSTDQLYAGAVATPFGVTCA